MFGNGIDTETDTGFDIMGKMEKRRLAAAKFARWAREEMYRLGQQPGLHTDQVQKLANIISALRRDLRIRGDG